MIYTISPEALQSASILSPVVRIRGLSGGLRKQRILSIRDYMAVLRRARLHPDRATDRGRYPGTPPIVLYVVRAQSQLNLSSLFITLPTRIPILITLHHNLNSR